MKRIFGCETVPGFIENIFQDESTLNYIGLELI